MSRGAAQARAGTDEITRLRRELRQHPCHGCPERDTHARQAEQQSRLEREVRGLEGTMAAARCPSAWPAPSTGCVPSWITWATSTTAPVTPDGRRLADLYTELDLLAAECLRRGLSDGLDPAELAACVAVLTFESRQRGRRRRAADAWRAGPRCGDLDGLGMGGAGRVEERNQVSFLRQPELGFAWAAHAWARGRPLETVLVSSELTPGDFVRAVKQLMDLLGQIAVAAKGRLRAGRHRADRGRGAAPRRGRVHLGRLTRRALTRPALTRPGAHPPGHPA